MKFLRTILLMLTLLPLTACGLSSDPIEGQVLEAGTKKPLTGAIVVVRWHGTWSAIAESKSVCYHVETTTTDGEGRYKISGWWQMPKGPFFGADEGADITAYKTGYAEYWPAGYDRTEDYKKNVRYLEPFKGTSEERLKYLRQLNGATSCGSSNESEKNRYPLIKGIYEEGREIARTDYEKYIVDWLAYEMNSFLLPSDKRSLLRTPDRIRSALLGAVERNNIPVARSILATGADVNDRNNDGATMLMVAIRYGFSEMAILLLNNGANPNATTFDDQNSTAMDYLLTRNMDYGIASADEIAALMIRKGFDMNRRDPWGNTVLQKSLKYRLEKNKEIVDVLEKADKGEK